jgi:hypothetical protein
MKSFIKTIALLLVLSISLGGCATYHLSTQSLVEQCANTHQQEKLNVVIAFPLFLPFEVTGNDLTEIKVLDKNNQEQILPVNHHTSVRIIKKNSKKNSFYFDTLILKDSTITGKKDHFIGFNITPINLNDIDRIEIQK